jgi:energy-converting hydrogenase A subunit M
MNKEVLLELAKICREKREERGVSLRALFDTTRIQMDIIEKLLSDEEYILRNYPYSKFLLMQVARALDIDVDEFEKQLTLKEDVKSKDNVDFKKVKKTVNTAVVSVLAISTMIYASTLNSKLSANNILSKYLKEKKVESKENNTYIALKDSSNSLDSIQENKIELVAKDNVWLTAYIDGIERVIKLKKGEKKDIYFFSKIKIETLGNPKNLVINFKGKEVRFNSDKKILHNIFIDAEGIFINGYNKLLDG